MQDLHWLIEQFAEARCVSCGARYDKGSVKVLGNKDEYWFVQVICPSCGTQGLGVAIVRTVEPGAAAGADTPSISADEVLDAHDLLKRYSGDVEGLFVGATSRQSG
jgi:hypothetical protein